MGVRHAEAHDWNNRIVLKGFSPSNHPKQWISWGDGDQATNAHGVSLGHHGSSKRICIRSIGQLPRLTIYYR